MTTTKLLWCNDGQALASTMTYDVGTCDKCYRANVKRVADRTGRLLSAHLAK